MKFIIIYIIVSFNILSNSYIYAKVPDYYARIAGRDDNEHLQTVLENILKPRVVGTASHENVRYFIENELKNLGFQVELDQFIAATPIFGNLTFTNIIGKVNPNADYYLTLACHYDSKYIKNVPNFLGAIDSAVPCSIMLNLAKVLLPELQNMGYEKQVGIMLIFFDGEEAFLEWNEYDSLYGSRHLAQKMEKTTSSLPGKNKRIKDINRIDVFVLLDLIGARNSKFYNFFTRTDNLHKRLVRIERILSKEKLIENINYMFVPERSYGRIDDDHSHFLYKNVPILHLIATPFPPQWHKSSDNAANLHWPSITNFNKILRILVYEYLILNKRTPALRTITEVL